MRVTILSAAFLLAMVPATVASGPNHLVLDTGIGYYVVDEGASGGVWVWQESNGHAGLQAGASCSPIVPNDCYLCGFDMHYDCDPVPDTLIF